MSQALVVSRGATITTSLGNVASSHLEPGTTAAMYKTYGVGEGRPYGNMVRADLIRQLRAVHEDRQRRIVLCTRRRTPGPTPAAGARSRQRFGRPDQAIDETTATPTLESSCTNVLERDGYRVENIVHICPWRGGAANLYLPAHATAAAPVSHSSPAGPLWHSESSNRLPSRRSSLFALVLRC